MRRRSRCFRSDYISRWLPHQLRLLRDSPFSSSPNIAPETYQQWTVESDRKKCKKPSESTLMFPHSTFFLPCLRLKTGNGPSRPAMRRGWWGSQGIPYCSLWRGLRSGLLPWPSEPVPHHPAPPVPPGCPC